MNTNLQPGRKLRRTERELITALAPGFRSRLDDALVTDMPDGGTQSIRFVGGNDRHRAGPLAEATYVDDDGIPVRIELNLDDTGRLFALDFWKVNFSPLSRYPTPENLLPTKNPPNRFVAAGTTRAEALRRMPPHLIADTYLYPIVDAGKRLTVQPGWGCLCCCCKSDDAIFYDCWPLLDAPFAPGERRRLGFVFLHGEYITGENIAAILRNVQTFYLFEGRFIGEATVVQ